MANQRKNYYETLEKIQKSDLDITAWLEWFLACLEAALLHAEKSVGTVLRKAAFWNKYREISMNDRQIKMVNLLWDGFEGKLTSSKWGKITKCSADTALRDIQALIAKGIFVPFMGKRSYTAFRFRLKGTAKKKNYLKSRKNTSLA